MKNKILLILMCFGLIQSNRLEAHQLSFLYCDDPAVELSSRIYANNFNSNNLADFYLFQFTTNLTDTDFDEAGVFEVVVPSGQLRIFSSYAQFVYGEEYLVRVGIGASETGPTWEFHDDAATGGGVCSFTTGNRQTFRDCGNMVLPLSSRLLSSNLNSSDMAGFYRFEFTTNSDFNQGGILEATLTTGQVATLSSISGMTYGETYLVRVSVKQNAGDDWELPHSSVAPCTIRIGHELKFKHCDDPSLPLNTIIRAENNNNSDLANFYRFEFSPDPLDTDFIDPDAFEVDLVPGQLNTFELFSGFVKGEDYLVRVSVKQDVNDPWHLSEAATPHCAFTIQGNSITLNSFACGNQALNLGNRIFLSNGNSTSFDSYRVQFFEVGTTTLVDEVIFESGTTSDTPPRYSSVAGLKYGESYDALVSARETPTQNWDESLAGPCTITTGHEYSFYHCDTEQNLFTRMWASDGANDPRNANFFGFEFSTEADFSNSFIVEHDALTNDPYLYESSEFQYGETYHVRVLVKQNIGDAWVEANHTTGNDLACTFDVRHNAQFGNCGQTLSLNAPLASTLGTNNDVRYAQQWRYEFTPADNPNFGDPYFREFPGGQNPRLNEVVNAAGEGLQGGTLYQARVLMQNNGEGWIPANFPGGDDLTCTFTTGGNSLTLNDFACGNQVLNLGNRIFLSNGNSTFYHSYRVQFYETGTTTLVGTSIFESGTTATTPPRYSSVSGLKYGETYDAVVSTRMSEGAVWEVSTAVCSITTGHEYSFYHCDTEQNLFTRMWASDGANDPRNANFFGFEFSTEADFSNSFIVEHDALTNDPYLYESSEFQYGETYHVRVLVKQNIGDAWVEANHTTGNDLACTFDVRHNAQFGNCGQTLSLNAPLASTLGTNNDVRYAQQWRYEFTPADNPNFGDPYFREFPGGQNPRLNEVVNAAGEGLQGGTLYQARVLMQNNGEGWIPANFPGGDDLTCTFTTGGNSLTLNDFACGNQVLNLGNRIFLSNGNSTFYHSYRVQFYETGTTTLVGTSIFESGTTATTPPRYSSVSGLKYGETYDAVVSTRMSEGAVWEVSTAVCSITTGHEYSFYHCDTEQNLFTRMWASDGANDPRNANFFGFEFSKNADFSNSFFVEHDASTDDPYLYESSEFEYGATYYARVFVKQNAGDAWVPANHTTSNDLACNFTVGHQAQFGNCGQTLSLNAPLTSTLGTTNDVRYAQQWRYEFTPADNPNFGDPFFREFAGGQTPRLNEVVNAAGDGLAYSTTYLVRVLMQNNGEGWIQANPPAGDDLACTFTTEDCQVDCGGHQLSFFYCDQTVELSQRAYASDGGNSVSEGNYYRFEFTELESDVDFDGATSFSLTMPAGIANAERLSSSTAIKYGKTYFVRVGVGETDEGPWIYHEDAATRGGVCTFTTGHEREFFYCNQTIDLSTFALISDGGNYATTAKFFRLEFTEEESDTEFNGSTAFDIEVEAGDNQRLSSIPEIRYNKEYYVRIAMKMEELDDWVYHSDAVNRGGVCTFQTGHDLTFLYCDETAVPLSNFAYASNGFNQVAAANFYRFEFTEDETDTDFSDPGVIRKDVEGGIPNAVKLNEIDGIKYGTTYYARVLVRQADGINDDWVAATTPILCEFTTEPCPAGLFTGTASSTPDNCEEGNGTATVTFAGGQAPYTISWSPGGETSQTITGLLAGNYTVTATDALGCSISESTTVVDNNIACGLDVSLGDALCDNLNVPMGSQLILSNDNSAEDAPFYRAEFVADGNVVGSVNFDAGLDNAPYFSYIDGLHFAVEYEVHLFTRESVTDEWLAASAEPCTLRLITHIQFPTEYCNNGFTPLTMFNKLVASDGANDFKNARYFRFEFFESDFNRPADFEYIIDASEEYDPYFSELEGLRYAWQGLPGYRVAVSVSQDPSDIDNHPWRFAEALYDQDQFNDADVVSRDIVFEHDLIFASCGETDLDQATTPVVIEGGVNDARYAAHYKFEFYRIEENGPGPEDDQIFYAVPYILITDAEADPVPVLSDALNQVGETLPDGTRFLSRVFVRQDEAHQWSRSMADDCEFRTKSCPIVSVTTQPELCENGEGSATANVTEGTAPYTYLWSPGGETTASISGLSSGEYTVTVTDSRGCEVSASGTVVADGEVPQEGISVAPIFVDVTANGTGIYEWMRKDDPTNVLYTTKTISVPADGTEYLIRVTSVNSENCQSISCIAVPDYTLEEFPECFATPPSPAPEEVVESVMNEEAGLYAKLYPNPNNGQFTFEFNNDSELEQTLLIYNAMGVLLDAHVLSTGKNVLNMDYVDQSTGMYMYQVVTQDNRVLLTNRFVIGH